MHQEQYQKSQGFVRQFHWKTAQELSSVFESHCIFMKAKALFQYAVLVHQMNSIFKLFENKSRPWDYTYKHYTQT